MGEKCDAKGIKQNVNRVGKISNEVLKLVVINDYECVRRCTFNTNALNDVLSDFQSLSVAKINIFFINNRGFKERYFSDKVHAILLA